MREKIVMFGENEHFLDEIFKLFVVSKTACGVSDVTLRNYHYHMKAISNFVDINRPINEISKREWEQMVVDMKEAGIKHNSIATYVRFLKTFFNWCAKEDFYSPSICGIREKETVKETYTDEELERLLRKPRKSCDFGEYRSWVIITHQNTTRKFVN